MSDRDFPDCPVCGSKGWTVVYDGPVRDGSFGTSKTGRVARCDGCGIDRLAESLCLTMDAYRGPEYRTHIGQDHNLENHYKSHDELARFTLDVLWPRSLREKTVADVGCGGGSLLDHLRGLPAQMLAIDPAEGFAPSLRGRGYRWFPGAGEAVQEFGGKVDVAFSIQVIEHVDDPKGFLSGIRTLLKSDGVLILSTPNRADILMELLPQDFPGFFYRTQHRWVFDSVSLTRCATEAGFRVVETRHIHRYGISNALRWLRDRKPTGRDNLPPLDRAADDAWRSWLEKNGRADNLYLVLAPA